MRRVLGGVVVCAAVIVIAIYAWQWRVEARAREYEARRAEVLRTKVLGCAGSFTEREGFGIEIWNTSAKQYWGVRAKVSLMGSSKSEDFEFTTVSPNSRETRGALNLSKCGTLQHY